jgi:rfaE bifunctional protein nucleotidyltransferase chain/domain
MNASKVVHLNELLRRTSAARQRGRKIVHCHGCFDMIHPGHVRYLEFAKRQADVLVVSLTGDSQITKGDQRPFIPQELRAESLAALAAVDLVYVNPHPTACELLRELQPDFYVKGREYEHSHDAGFLAEREIVAGYGGRVLFSSGDVVFSSSRLIEALAPDAAFDHERLAVICRRHEVDRASLEALMARFAAMNVLVVGDVILDRYVLCDATDLASEAPMMSLTQQEERVYVGGAGIVARHVAAMGAKAHLLTGGGDSEACLAARATIEGGGVSACFVPARGDLPEKTRYLVDTNKLFRVEKGQSQPLDSVAEEQAAGWVASLGVRFDAVIFCDFGY